MPRDAGAAAILTATIPPAAPLLLTTRQAWQHLGVSRAAFFRLRSADLIPAPVHVPGSGLRYRRADLERWAEKLKPARR